MPPRIIKVVLAEKRELFPILHFQDSDGPLKANEFIEFIRMFRAAYVISLGIVAQDDFESQSHGKRFRRYCLEHFRNSVDAYPGNRIYSYDLSGHPIVYEARNYEELTRWLSRGFSGKDLEFLKIEKSSPLVITCICVIPALAIATIISGGEADLVRMKFKLKPLGEGIRRLREALQPNFPRKASRKSKGKRPDGGEGNNPKE